MSLFPLSVFATSPHPFNFSCSSTGGVYSDGQGGVWLQGQPATIKQMSDNYWEARRGKVVLSITCQSDGNPDITFTGPAAPMAYVCQKINAALPL